MMNKLLTFEKRVPLQGNMENKCFGIPHYLCSHISSKCITSVFIRVS